MGKDHAQALITAQPGVAMAAGSSAMQGVMNMQPGGAQWMQRPNTIPGVPPGLEYLTLIDQVLIKQQMEMLEIFTGFEGANKYKILNSVGQQIYFASEESDFCQRQCMGTCREFNMHIVDNTGVEVIRVFRPCKVIGCGCCSCDKQELVIEAPPGNKVATMRQDCNACTPHLQLYDQDDSPSLHIEGPCSCCICPSCPCDIEFKVLSMDKVTQVGKITKQWSGYLKEAFTDADNFGISFPMDLDVRMKAALIGALFIIDFMFFEDSGDGAAGMV